MGTHDENHRYIKGGGEMGDLIRRQDWSQSPVGPIDSWSISLRAQINLILNSRFPMLIFWGPELITFYNDAFRQSLGINGKHPASLGQTGAQSWAESWQVIGPMVDDIMKGGEPVYVEDQKLPLFRNGAMGYAYWTYSFSPLFGDTNEINGLLVTCSETTDAVESFQRLNETNADLIQTSEENVMLQKKALRNEVRFRDLIEASSVGTAVYIGSELRIQIANETILHYWGKGKKVVGKRLVEVMPELSGQPFIKILTRVFETGEVYREQEAIANVLKDGRMQASYFNIHYTALRDETGTIYGVLDTAVDVTDQVTARIKLEESEKFSRTVFYNSPVAKLVYTGENMVLTEANEKMLHLLGKDTSIIGRPIMESVPEMTGANAFKKYQLVLNTGMAHNEVAERIELIRDGVSHIGYYDNTYKPLFDLDGKTYGVICTAIDVTEQVIARQKLEEAEQTFRGAVELAQLGTWSIDVATNGLTYSDRLIKWFGYDPAAQDFRQVIPILSQDDQERVEKAVTWGLNPESGGIYDEIYTVIHPVTGVKRILHAQGKTVFDAEGRPLRMNGTAQDITIQVEAQLALEHQVQERTEEIAAVVEELRATNDELEKTNIKLIQSNDQLAQFAYIASHDLQEPLRKISTFSQILQHHLGDHASEETEKYIDKIVGSAARMRKLISDVLDYSQLVKGETVFEKTDLNEVLQYILADYDLLIEQKSAAILFEKLPVIDAIPLQMMQMFRNLIGNALKFTREGVRPEVRIAVGDAPQSALDRCALSANVSYYCITISDNGIGIAAEYVDKIFNIFQRLHSKTQYEGTGIGLAMCKKIALIHYGDIYAAGIPDEGTSFFILLPKSIPDTPEAIV